MRSRHIIPAGEKLFPKLSAGHVPFSPLCGWGGSHATLGRGGGGELCLCGDARTGRAQLYEDAHREPEMMRGERDLTMEEGVAEADVCRKFACEHLYASVDDCPAQWKRTPSASRTTLSLAGCTGGELYRTCVEYIRELSYFRSAFAVPSSLKR